MALEGVIVTQTAAVWSLPQGDPAAVDLPPALARGPWTDGVLVTAGTRQEGAAVPSPSLVHSAWTVQESTHFQPEAKSERVCIGLQTEG